MTTTLKMPATAGATATLLTINGTMPVRDVALDGNRVARGWPGGYAWEHSALLFLSSGTFDLDRLTLANSAGDGISIHTDATVTINDVTATDCFRSAVTMTGGNTSVTIDNLQGSWLQIEEDTNGTGGVTTIALTMTNSTIPEGVELEANGPITITNCNLGRRFWIEARGGQPVRITDCQIRTSKTEADFGGAFTDISQVDTFGCSIYYPRDIIFTRCAFTGCGLELRPDALIAEFTATGQSIEFIDCTFVGSGPAAVYNYGQVTGSGRTNTVKFTRCTYSGFDSGYVLRNGFTGTLVGSLPHA